jgi:hypothetical protein
MKSIFGLLSLSLAIFAYAETGDYLYVKGDVVNMRSEPSTESNVIVKLRRGHRLIEIQKKGKWIEVGADSTGGKTGWIYASLTSTTPLHGKPDAIGYPPFSKFVDTYYNRLNKGLFTKAEYKGDGIINIHVNYKWMSVSREDKTWSMNVLLDAWSKCDRGVVSINMVSPSGKFVMSNIKR